MGKTIRVAIVGSGNCASALVQGIAYYKTLKEEDEAIGLMHFDMGGYLPGNIEIVAAFDVDSRKVGKPLCQAIFSPPNNTKVFFKEVSEMDVVVQMGPVLDGVSPHMSEYPEEMAFVVATEKPVEVAEVLIERQVEILINYLPVGSRKATEYYAEACLKTGVGLINCIPVLIVSDQAWGTRFEKGGIPVIGDDVKSQIGATVIHRTLMELLSDRGVKVKRTYQLNTGGNTDFLNMLNRERLKEKKLSKTEAVQSVLDQRLDSHNIHIGPSDFVPWQKDNKICFMRIEGVGFGGVPMELELRLSVEDSPNSAGVVIDAIRYCKIAQDRGEAGPLLPIAAYTMKHPPQQMNEKVARSLIEEYLARPTARVSKKRETHVA